MVECLLKLRRMLKSGTKNAPPPTPAAVATDPICRVQARRLACRPACCCTRALLQERFNRLVPLCACHKSSAGGSPQLTGLVRICSCHSCPTYACECPPLLHWLPYRHAAAHQLHGPYQSHGARNVARRESSICCMTADVKGLCTTSLSHP